MRKFYTIACIPALNESSTIAGIVARSKKYVNKVFVVDDGSSDKTRIMAQAAGATVISHRKNVGYGAALKTIFQIAREKRADALVIIDGDGQHDPDEIPKVLKPVLSGLADVVIGSRFVGGSRTKIPPIRRVGMVILNFATQLMGARVTDTQSGFRAYSKRALSVINPNELGMAAGSEILIQASNHGLRITEVGASCKYEEDPDRSRSQFAHGLEVLLSLVKLSVQKNESEG